MSIPSALLIKTVLRTVLFWAIVGVEYAVYRLA